jgi:hypothetical protein
VIEQHSDALSASKCEKFSGGRILFSVAQPRTGISVHASWNVHSNWDLRRLRIAPSCGSKRDLSLAA